jgi:uncharacterized protein (DUF1810 family)
MEELSRFREAQDGRPGFAQAMGELRAGRKTGHWIWYVFPQLRGLGRSPMAVRYGLEGLTEAVAYLRHRGLADRLAAVAAVVRAQLAAGVRLDHLMGSSIDAVKLVSCMTLFHAVAAAEQATIARPALAALAGDAEAILEVAANQGYRRCAFTEARLRAAGM